MFSAVYRSSTTTAISIVVSRFDLKRPCDDLGIFESLNIITALISVFSQKIEQIILVILWGWLLRGL